MHEYSVELLVKGKGLVESEVSERLGLQCTGYLREGEPLPPKRHREQSVWSFAVRPSVNNPDWESLEDGLVSLIQKLLPVKGALTSLRQRYSTEAYCGHFGSGFGGGPSISPETLRSLADLGLTLTIKSYWTEEQLSSEPESDNRSDASRT
jgi:hypothetical protein